MQFSHLHVHTQFSLLDGAAPIKGLVAKAKEDGMPALAITDHGNMFGSFKFFNEVTKAGLKPIMGCEFYLVEDRHVKSFSGGKRDKRFHQLLLAKNQKGYSNLSKLCSLGYLEGLYSKFPRIDMELLKQYSEGLICTTCCIGAQIPQAILFKGEEEAEELFKHWHGIFGDDFYVELQRHGLKDIDGTGLSQEDVNQTLIKFARKYDVSIIATNDSHYVEKDDANAHDILLCINTGEFQSTPKASNEGSGKGFRFGFPNEEFFFKTTAEMEELFKDLPEALDNTNKIIDSITTPQLKRDILLPAYPLPTEFKSQESYLRHLCVESAKRKLGGSIPAQYAERLEFELQTIISSGYEGYFLIVQDFTTAAREMDVWVGPGRGSAAGSLVSYLLGITNVDPVKYDLLFERFLNPERVSMPDVDIDFEDRNRDKVLEYVADKYGHKQIAQIVTYGTMAVKSAIKDVARVKQLELAEANRITKLVPLNLKFKDILHAPIEEVKKKIKPEELEGLNEIRKSYLEQTPLGEVLRDAEKLEGSVRNTGVHACGLIIAPEDITNIVPASVSKDSPYQQVQYDVKVIEDAGLLKMDFLGLSTLSILKDTVNLIKRNHGISIDLDELPLDDKKTYELFQHADTNGVFQFESDGMKSHMRNLKPTQFEHLIAMNALYRPGPIQYIPNFIRRKNGVEKVEYDLPELKEYLEDTFGITVYQEQVMLLSQKLAGFSKGKADELRKAMGKKNAEKINELEALFMEGAIANGYPEDKLKKIYNDWKEFAAYAFNKSHSTCYALIAYHSAYLKANYTAEFMASLLQNSIGDIKNITKYMGECRRMGLDVLGPDLNESQSEFSVTPKGALRFGLGAIKGVGGVDHILKERDENGPFKNVFDLTSRVKSVAVNKKNLEGMTAAGVFDFDPDISREMMLFAPEEGGNSGIEIAIKYGSKVQSNKEKGQFSMFSDSDDGFSEPEPKLKPLANMPLLEKLRMEYDVVGLYISEHPMDQYRLEYEVLSSHEISQLDEELSINKPLKFRVVGMVSESKELMAKNGKHFGAFTLSDYTGNSEFRLFGDEYHKMKQWLTKDYFIVVSGEHSASRYDANKFYTNIKSIAYLPDIHETNLVNHVKIVLTNSDLSDKADEHIEVESTLPIADVGLDIDVDAPLENEELSSAPLVFKTKGTDLISHLTSLFKDYPGETPVFVNFIDVDDNLNISLLKSEGVEYKAEFRQKLKDLGVDFKEKLNGNW